MTEGIQSGKYRIAFMSLFLLLLIGWAILSIIILIPSPSINEIIGALVAGVLVTGFITQLCIVFYPVTVTNSGISVRDSNNKIVFVEWSTIKKVKAINFLTLKYLKLYRRDGGAAVWMPISLQDKLSFIESVNRYSNEENPLRVYINTGSLVEANEYIETEGGLGESEAVNVTDERIIENRLKEHGTIKNGAGWFYWVAGLSIVNTVIFVFRGDWSFIFGLSITQIIDAIAYEITLEAPELNSFILAFSTAVNLAIAGMFIIFGYFAQKRRHWSFVAGMIFYALDGVIALLFEDFLLAGFHLLVLYWIYNGLKASQRLSKLEKTVQE